MEAREPDPAIDRASSLLVAERGHPRVDSLVRRSGLSASRLQRRFALRVGMTPKLFARTVRFDAALVARRNDPSRTWTDIVHDLGYFDQAHFVRECRAFAGFRRPASSASGTTCFSRRATKKYKPSRRSPRENRPDGATAMTANLTRREFGTMAVGATLIVADTGYAEAPMTTNLERFKAIVERGFSRGDMTVADEVCAEKLIEHQYLARTELPGPQILKAQIEDARRGIEGLTLPWKPPSKRATRSRHAAKLPAPILARESRSPSTSSTSVASPRASSLSMGRAGSFRSASPNRGAPASAQMIVTARTE